MNDGLAVCIVISAGHCNCPGGVPASTYRRFDSNNMLLAGDSFHFAKAHTDK